MHDILYKILDLRIYLICSFFHVALEPNPAFLNSFLYAAYLLFGTVILTFLLMPLNAFLPTDFRFLLLIVMLFNLLHL